MAFVEDALGVENLLPDGAQLLHGEGTKKTKIEDKNVRREKEERSRSWGRTERERKARGGERSRGGLVEEEQHGVGGVGTRPGNRRRKEEPRAGSGQRWDFTVRVRKESGVNVIKNIFGVN